MKKLRKLNVVFSFLLLSFLLLSLSDKVYGTYNNYYKLPKLTGNYVSDFLNVAKSQLGYKGTDTKETVFSDWTGTPRTAWCSEFVSWCADKAGIPHNIIPICTDSHQFRSFFAGQGRYFVLDNGIDHDACLCSYSSSGTISVNDIEPGDILLMEGDGDFSNGPDHTCICISVSGGKITSIDGNSENEVMYRERSAKRVHGVCKPNFTNIPQIIKAPKAIKKEYKTKHFYVKATSNGNGTLRYSCSNSKVATINSYTGLVTIKGIGKATITISAGKTEKYLSNTITIPLTITKNKPKIVIKSVKKISNSTKYVISSSCKTNKLIYKSTNKKLATVNQKGEVTIKKGVIGKVTINVKAVHNRYYGDLIKPVTITIRPQKTTITSMKLTKTNNFMIHWKKDSKVSGYQIQYATSNTFGATAKTILITDKNKEKFTLSNLDTKRTYYIRIRTYKTINNTNYFSKWSAPKNTKSLFDNITTIFV